MQMNTSEIMEIIPHRPPFLLVDRIIEMDEENQRAVGIKNITMNEPQFQGHFPGRPIMPGVLMVEALAQVGAVMILKDPNYQGKLAVFTGINNFKFKKQVEPGDTLRLEVQMTAFKRVMGKANAEAYIVNGDEKVFAAGGEISFAIVDK